MAEKDIKKINDEISKLRRELGERPLKPFDEKDLDTAQRYLQGLRAEVREMGGDLDYISKSFKDSVNELSRQNTYLVSTRKALSQISDISRNISSYRKGETNLTEKQLQNLQKQAKVRFEDLKLAARSGTLSKEQREEINAAIREEESFNKAVEKTIKAQKEVNKEIGLAGKGLEGMGKLIEKMGFEKVSNSISEGIQKTKEARLQYKLNQDAISDLNKEIQSSNTRNLSDAQIRAGFGGKYLKDLASQRDEISRQNEELKSQGNRYKNILSSLKEQFTFTNLLDSAITQLFMALKSSDDAAGDMAKKMNMTYSEALNIRREFGNMAAMSMDVAVNTKGLQESYMAIGQSLGSNAMASEETLVTFTKLREQAGYTNDQLAELNKLSLVNGKSLEDNTKEILGGAKAYASRKGLVINEKEILNDVVNASASLKLSLGGSADKLAEAAVKTRAVGINLETAANMAEQLLNFESSIENELSAELLLGKDLNFEKARQLALNNDIAGAAEEIANQVGSSADFAKMNAIQQEAIAKAAGMTKDQLAQSLMEREALAKLSGVEGKDAKEKFDNLVKQVGLEEAKKRLGDEQLATQFAQQSVQERFAQAIEKLQEVFIQIAEPILAIVSPLMSLVSTVLPAINVLLQPLIQGFQFIGDIISFISNGISSFVGWLNKGSAAATALKIVLAPIAAVVGVIAAGMIYASLSAIPVIGPALGAIAVVGMISMLAKAAMGASSEAKKGNDIVSPGGSGGGYGKRTLFGPEGAIQLNDKDTVIAGTNLFDKKADDMVSAPKGAISVSNSTAPKKETPVDPNAGTNARLDALIATTGRVNAIPTLKIQ